MNKDEMFQNDFSYCKKSKQICKIGQCDTCSLEYTIVQHTCIDKNFQQIDFLYCSNNVFKVALFRKERSILSLRRYINPQYFQNHPLLFDGLWALHEVKEFLLECIIV